MGVLTRIDGRALFKNLMIGLKTVLFGLKSCNPPPPANSGSMSPQQWSEAVRGLTSADLEVFIYLFEQGALGFSFYRPENTSEKPKLMDKTSLDGPINLLTPNSREEKDILETFATVFIHLDPAAFQEIFDVSLPRFYDQVMQNTILLHVPQFFLTNDATSPSFAGLLLQFLVDRLPELGSPEPLRSSILLRMFKMCFMAVTMFPDLNEAILQPHLANIIIQSMKLSAKAENSLSYYILMRALFRSIGGGRFELLYKEVLPLLQVLLECLNTLLQAARKQQEKELFVELCLTVPVRLSVLLPYLSYLMKPLVIALTAGSDLVTQGLRTLELCIDNLTQEFLDPILAPVLPELMQALWSHLRPLPHNHHHSHSALRILGKMGGRNRRFVDDSQVFTSCASANDLPAAMIHFHNSEEQHAFCWTKFVPYAVRVIQDPKMDLFYKEKALSFLIDTLKLTLKNEEPADNLAASLRVMARELVNREDVSKEVPHGAIATKDVSDSDNVKSYQARLIERLRIQETSFKRALTGIFAAASIPGLSPSARGFVVGMSKHFAILHLIEAHRAKKARMQPFSIETTSSHLCISVNAFLDGLVDAMTSESDEDRALTQESLLVIHKTCDIILGLDGETHALPIFSSLIGRFCHCCFEEAFRKTAGVYGISVLTEHLALPVSWYQTHQVEMVKALLFVIKDIMPEIPTSSTIDAIRLLRKVISGSFEASDSRGLATSPLVSVLVSELANPNGRVRETAQEMFRCISELTSVSIQEILRPVQERLLTPIFTKPLRALPFAMQIGHIDAITFCLSLSSSFLDFNDELLRLLHEALALADAEDDALVSVNRTSQYKSSSALVNLRIVCIKLLTIAVSSPDFASPQQAQSRSRIIAVFFKSLYSKSVEVVDVANKGLKQVLNQNQKLPKDLLQAGLRPILMNLSDHKRLTVPGLEGLARLLELLTNYFKVEIGKKLLDHLRAWSDPIVLQQISGKPLREQQSVKIIAAILNIFHLLPPSAHMFMDELIVAVCDLEEKLRRTRSSPLRYPLLLFINRYPSETWDYMRTKKKDVAITQFLLQLADEKISVPFRKIIAENSRMLLQDTKIEKSASNTSFLVRLFHIISKHEPNFVLDREQLQELMSFHRSVVLADMATSGHELCQVGALLIEVNIRYMSECPSDVVSLVALLEAQSERILEPSDQLESYLLRQIIMSGPIGLRRNVFMKALDVFAEPDRSQSLKVALFRRIIIPIILSEDRGLATNAGVIDKAVMDHIHLKVWKTALSDFGDDLICASDILRMEVLQMSTILLRNHTSLISDTRKDVIKFAWNYIKLDDITTKNAAYVCICYFVAAYDTPSKMVAQIYFALLRTPQPEARYLVRQALDALAVVLTKRIPAGADVKSPSWAKYPRKVMAEESSTLQLIPVYQFITRHEKLFTICCEQFIPQILASLPKLAFPQNSNLDAKVVVVDLAELLLKWARTDIHNLEDSELGLSPDRIFSTVQIEQLLRFLLRFICLPLEASKKELILRSVKTLDALLKIDHRWNENIPILVLEPFLLDIDEKSSSSAVNALEVLNIVTSQPYNDALRANFKILTAWVERSLRSEIVSVVSALQPLLCNILSLTDGVEEFVDELSELKNKVVTIVQENIQGDGSVQGSLLVLETLAKHSEASLDVLIPSLMKLFNNLIKDHIGPRSGVAISGGSLADNLAPTATGSSTDADLNLDAIISLLDVMCLRMLQLGEQRRFFLAAIAQLIDKSPSSKLCSHVLTLISQQVIDKREAFPTVKEKVSLLLKMTSFEGRGDDELVNQYLKLIIAIYKEPSIARTEFTVRLEQAFLMGTRAHRFEIRTEFMQIFNSSMSRSSYTRLNYIFSIQNWESLSSHYWIHQACHLLLGSIATERPLIASTNSYKFQSLAHVDLSSVETIIVDDRLEELLVEHSEFLSSIAHLEAGNMFGSLSQLEHLDVDFSELLWAELFPHAWSALPRKDRQEIAKAMTVQLSKEFHLRQVDRRPNVVHTLLLGISRCEPLISLPPHLVKYLAKTFNSWYIGLDLLERSASQLRIEEPFIGLQESTLDALTETYAALSEDDMFYGLWRVRCKYPETNAAISYEQNGMWDKAQQLYEQAQVKARSGTVPFLEPEYTLWEDHWILCAQKLQQWDVLTDLAKQEGYSDLLLECAWRISDWTSDREPLEASIRSLMDIPTPRRYTFEAFMTLQKTQTKQDSVQEFQKICDEGMQLSLRKWHQLPDTICQTHVPLLQSFQQYVELQEASQIYGSLASTQAQNLEAKSHELKHILQTWRERLPNFYDDINGWSDLVAWRQLVFAMINRVYLPLVPALQQPSAPNNNSSATSFAYRGYHETAWIINRFAHVARKHQLPDVCINQLTKIYTLPNIEIQEAFLKLREQAKCHYQNPAELNQGLEVISNTNLMYFGTQQKAEFFTLKGMFLAKLKLNEEANQAFATAIQIDLTLPKAWAEWGQYSDRLFQEDPTELTKAGNAVSCYLQAAGLYKNGRARNMLSRVLWLLSLDDSEGTVASAFDSYKGDVPTWYWITFIPQLLTSLSHKEARHARQILIRIAKTFPQSLHFQLRTTKEDYAVIKKQALAAAQNVSVTSHANSEAVKEPDPDVIRKGSVEKTSDLLRSNSAVPLVSPAAPTVGLDPIASQSPHAPATIQNRQPWEHVDEIMAILKTAYPLLALSMETMVDQVQQRFKCHADEDAYRLIVALLNDGVQVRLPFSLWLALTYQVHWTTGLSHVGNKVTSSNASQYNPVR